LQQTRVETVKNYFHSFLHRFPTVADLAAADLQEVLKVWEGMGYYARARHLHHAAKVIVSQYKGDIPVKPEIFFTLPGVGPYIGAAVLSIACRLPLPVVDGNVLRVISRFRADFSDIAKPAARREAINFLRPVIPIDQPGPFNEAMMELGSQICLPRNPRCGSCPLAVDCIANSKELSGQLPVKMKKGSIPEYQVAVALLIKRGRIYIQKRPDSGHLGGLWEFPGGKLDPGETKESALKRECFEELGVEIDVREKVAEVRHAYTHFRVHLHLFAAGIAGGRWKPKQPGCWIDAGEWTRYPFPAANHRLFPVALRFIAAQKKKSI